jgi:hypothetical protein
VVVVKYSMLPVTQGGCGELPLVTNALPEESRKTHPYPNRTHIIFLEHRRGPPRRR